jgi:FkbM family methyltransferase
MSRLSTALRLSLRTATRYGLAAALGVLRVGLGGGGEALAHARAVRLPGLQRPLWLRPGTSDLANFAQVFLDGQLDLDAWPQGRELIVRAGAAASVVVDAGAYIGLSSIRLATLFPGARILAIEPDPANAATLRRNVEGLPQVEVVEAGVWDRECRLAVVNAHDHAWERRVEEAADGPVRGLAIDDLLRAYAGRPLAAVKLIVEGAEARAFAGDPAWLDRAQCVVFMPNDWQRPWSGAGRTAMRALAAQPFDWAVRDLVVIGFRDPNADQVLNS